jgi:hypothetical protein
LETDFLADHFRQVGEHLLVARQHRFDVGELFIDFRETLVTFQPTFRGAMVSSR